MKNESRTSIMRRKPYGVVSRQPSRLYPGLCREVSRRICAVVAAFAVTILGIPLPSQAQESAPPKSLQIVILQGEGALNNVKARTAREPIIRVQDENHRPVAGAAILFTAPDAGPGGSFAGGAHTFATTTDFAGRAHATGFT